MGRLEWNDEIHSLGIPVIDNQHKHFIDLINMARDLGTEKAEQKRLDEVFQSLINYINYHFLFEESLMRKFGYPELEAHMHQHAVFTAKVHRLRSTYESSLGDSDSILPVLTNLLSKWIVAHLIEEDQKMGPLLREHLQAMSEEKVLELIRLG